MCMFQEIIFFNRKKNEKKNALQGGVVPRGGLHGGCRAIKKSFQKKSKVSSPKKKCPKKNRKRIFFNVPNLLYTPYGRVSEKQFFFYREKKLEKKFALQGV